MKKNKELIGAEIDGVIAYNHQNKAGYPPQKLDEYYERCELTYHGLLKNIDILITQRRINYKLVTVKWLVKYPVQCKKVIMFPENIEENENTLTEFKANISTT